MIKVRAWNEVDGAMIEWATLKGNPGLLGRLITDKVKHHKVMQFTGLTDKNGVEIYEGDLIEVCNNNHGALRVEFVNAYVGGWVSK